MRNIFFGTLMAAGFGLLGACSGSGSEGGKAVSASVGLNLVSTTSGANSFLNRFSSKQEHSKLLGANYCGDGGAGTLNDEPDQSAFQYIDGMSGAPEFLTVNLRKIALKTKDGADTILFESSTSAGVEITLENGEVDLSGITLSSELIAGTYDKVELTFANAAEVKGEFTGSFSVQCADTDFCEEMDTVPDTILACTWEDLDIFTLLSQNPGVPLSRDQFGCKGVMESTLVALKQYAPNYAGTVSPDENAVFEFDIPGAIVVEEGTEIELTMLVDLNTFLKFEANVRGDGQEMFANMPNKPFFFAANFEKTAMVYVGEPGTIEGYDVYACYDNSPNNSNFSALGIPADFRVTRNWMTVIRDAQANVIGGLISTYDPTGFVLLTGPINSHTADVRPSALSAALLSTPFAADIFGVAEPEWDLLLGNSVTGGRLNGFFTIEADSEERLGDSINSAGETTRIGGDSLDFNWHYTRVL
jgi:hypothetical protein